MDKRKFDEVVNKVKVLISGGEEDVGPIDSSLARDIMVAALHIPCEVTEMPSSFEDLTPDLAAKGLFTLVSVSIEDALRGPMRDFDKLSDEGKSFAVRTVKLGLQIASGNWTKVCDLDDVTYSPDPSYMRIVKNTVEMMKNGSDLFFGALDRCDLSTMSLGGHLQYDKNARVFGGGLVAAKALFAVNGYDDSVIEKVMDDIFRLKGILHVHGDERRHVLQGVHRLLELKPSMPWWDEAPASKLVFIGREQQADALRARLQACLAAAPTPDHALQAA